MRYFNQIALTLACLIVVMPTSLRAVPIQFEGSAQSFSLLPTASGFATVQGAQPISGYLLDDQSLFAFGTVSLADDSFTYVVTNNPSTVGPLKVTGLATLIGQPQQVGVPRVGDNFPPPETEIAFDGGQPTSLTGFNFVLGTGFLGVSIDGMNVPRTTMKVNPTYNGDPDFGPPYLPSAESPVQTSLLCLIGTTFLEQDPARDATFVPTGPGIGTYTIPAIFHVDFSSSLKFFSFIPGPSFPATTVSAPFDLVGTYKLTGPPDQATLELDGSQKISVPLLGFSHAVAADSGTLFGLTATFDFQSAALDFALNYHLTTQVAIPEPGSVLLLAIGLAALAPVAVRHLRRRYKPLARGRDSI